MIYYTKRDCIVVGNVVSIETKVNLGTGTFTKTIVDRVLTCSLFHSHGINVRLQDECIGCIKEMQED